LLAQIVLADFAGSAPWKEKKLPAPAVPPLEEITAVLQQRVYRPARLAEIVAQAENLELYWSNLLMIGPHGRPYSTALVATAMAVGHMVGMYWKAQHRRARPVQVFPAVMPAIMTPPHPSYPSNHSFQSHLIAHCLCRLFKEPVAEAMRAPLFALAARIGENREIAGVHFPSDTDAGRDLAASIFELLQQGEPFKQLLAKAAIEGWQEDEIAVGGRPQSVGPAPRNNRPTGYAA